MPALSDYQVSFNGLTMGADTDYELVETDGLEAVTTSGSDVEFTSQWGASAGPARVMSRVVTLTIEAMAETESVRHALETALAPTLEGDLSAFNWKWPDREELTALARVDRWTRPHRWDTQVLAISPYTVMLVMPDPRKYSAATNSAALSPYAPSGGGLDFTSSSGANLATDFTASSGANLAVNFSTASGVGDFNCTNLGNTATYPEITFTTTGGMAEYSLTNTTNGDEIVITQSLSAGEELVADMYAAVTGSGSPILYQGVNRYGEWQSPRLPFKLDSGTNVLRFEVLSGSASSTCSVAWPNAYV